MDLRERINADVKEGLKAKEKARVGVLRQVLAAIKQVEVDTREAPDEAGILAIFDKMIKQRKESITQFDEAGRTDLSDKEKFELQIIEGYMPEPLSDAEVATMIEAAIAEVGATSMKEMGKVMAILKPKIAGKGDFGAVSAKVKGMLG